MIEVLKDKDNPTLKKRVREEIRDLCLRFPIPDIMI